MKKVIFTIFSIIFLTCSLHAYDEQQMSTDELIKQMALMQQESKKAQEEIKEEQAKTERLKKLKQTTKKLVNTLEKNK